MRSTNNSSKIMSFFHKRYKVISNTCGLTRLFVYGELVCFPISVGVIGIVAVHSLLVLLMPLFAKIGMPLAIPTVLPSWFVAVFVSVAIGYLTNYIAIQMLYYPVDAMDLDGDGGGVGTHHHTDAGQSTLCVSPCGDVMPCNSFPVVCGNIRRVSLAKIWHASEVFRRLRRIRRKDVSPRCASCEDIAYCTVCPGASWIETQGRIAPCSWSCGQTHVRAIFNRK